MVCIFAVHMQRTALTGAEMGSYLFTTSHTGLTIPPTPLPCYLHLCLFLSYCLTTSFLCTHVFTPPSPAPDGAFFYFLASFLSWKACQDSDILIIYVHIPHFIASSLFLQYPLPLRRLHFSFFSVCLSVSLPFFCLSACWR